MHGRARAEVGDHVLLGDHLLGEELLRAAQAVRGGVVGRPRFLDRGLKRRERLAARLGVTVRGFSFHVGSQAPDARKHVEAMLSGQASALQAMFVRLSERAMEQTLMPNLEGFMRLALRAQSQCRATLETLAVLKNPPVVYAKQANVTTGPQEGSPGRPKDLLITRTTSAVTLQWENGPPGKGPIIGYYIECRKKGI